MLRTLLILVFSNTVLYSQDVKPDSISVKNQPLKFNYKQLIIPTILIGYGLIGIESDQIKSFNSEVKEEVNENIDEKVSIDDFSQFIPATSVYGLNAMGIKGKNNFKNRTIILGTSYLIMSATVFSLKSVTHIERPDGSNFKSFPSGHTANAFVGAEFLWQEYKDVSIWYGISGYLIATGTGLFRIYNDKHWLTDVAAGAGIGILSTKIAYWINPFMQEKIFNSKEKNSTSAILPFYNRKHLGVGFVRTF